MSPLEQLRDIHLPAEPGWWPPAPGWWVVGLLGLLLLLGLGWIIGRKLQRRQRHQLLMNMINQCETRYQKDGDSVRLSRDISALLKRRAIQCYGRQAVAGLEGSRWVTFLNDTVAEEGVDFSALCDAPFMQAADIDGRGLIQASRQWMRAHV